MAITSQAEYQAAMAAAADLGNVQRAKERARIEAEWAQYQATQQAALTAAQIAAEQARIAELDNVARAKAAAALALQTSAQLAVQTGVKLTGNTTEDQINLRVAELLKANPVRQLPDTTTLTDEQFFDEWADLTALSTALTNVSGGQGSRVVSQSIIEQSDARANFERAGGMARLRKIESELWTPQRAKVLEVIQIMEREGMRTFKRGSWQSLLTMIAIVATVGYAAGATPTATAGTGTATATGTTAGTSVATTEVTKDIVVAGVNTGFSTGSAALNTVIGQAGTGAVSGAVVGAATPGGSASKGAEAGAKTGATSAAVGEVKQALPDATIGISFDEWQNYVPEIKIGIPKSTYTPILKNIIDSALKPVQTSPKMVAPEATADIENAAGVQGTNWKAIAGIGLATAGLLLSLR